MTSGFTPNFYVSAIQRPCRLVKSKSSMDLCIGEVDPARLKDPLRMPEKYKDVIHICEHDDLNKVVSFRMEISEENDLRSFIKEWIEYSNVKWRVKKTDPTGHSKGQKNVFWRQFHCQSSSFRMRPGTKRPNVNHTSCKARLTVTLRNVVKKTRSKDSHMPHLPTKIELDYSHNHDLDGSEAIMVKDVPERVKNKFTKMFEDGHTPSTALDMHQEDIQMGNDDMDSGSFNTPCAPSIFWCHRLYSKLFPRQRKKLSTNIGKMIEKKLQLFDPESKYSLYTLEDEDIVVAICTPIMRRISENWSPSGQTIFIDPIYSANRQGYKTYAVLAPSPLGGLPIGILIIPLETKEYFTMCLNNLKHLLGNNGFYGKGSDGPSFMFADDSELERSTIEEVFPKTRLLLSPFRLLESTWKYIWDAKQQIALEHRITLFSHIKRLIFANDEEQLNEYFNLALNDKLVMEYYACRDFISQLWIRKCEWALCTIDELTCDDFAFTSEICIKAVCDNVFRRKVSFDVIQLIDFVLTRVDKYYERKISIFVSKNEIINDIFYLDEKFDVELSDQNLYVVTSKNETSYSVDIDTGLCTCFARRSGGKCKHQYVVSEKYKIEEETENEVLSEKSRMELMKVVENGEEGEEVVKREEEGEEEEEEVLDDDNVLEGCVSEDGVVDFSPFFEENSENVKKFKLKPRKEKEFRPDEFMEEVVVENVQEDFDFELEKCKNFCKVLENKYKEYPHVYGPVIKKFNDCFENVFTMDNEEIFTTVFQDGM